MKKMYLALSLASVSLMFTQSCIKCDKLLPEHKTPVVRQETVNATVAENSSYSYTLPAGDGASEITSSATHAKASYVISGTIGTNVYQYTPPANYVGTDVVVITTHLHNAQNTSGGCFGSGGGSTSHHGGGGNCGNHYGNDEQTIITTININVTPVSTLTAQTATALGQSGLN